MQFDSGPEVFSHLHPMVTTQEHPVLLATKDGAPDTWRGQDLRSAECAGLTTRILRNSPLQHVTGVWNLRKKKQNYVLTEYVLNENAYIFSFFAKSFYFPIELSKGGSLGNRNLLACCMHKTYRGLRAS